jgi:hypothetical protein
MPWKRSLYPKGWRAIVKAVRERSGGRCECAGECGRHAGRCERAIGGVTPSGFPIVLTTAHLWRGPCAEHAAAGVKCGELAHLAHMCQACHLAYDLPHHVANARATRRAKKATRDLFA